MRTESEIRMQGMQALIGSLGLIETERFLIAVNQDKFNYTEWRRQGLPDMSIEQIAATANEFSNQLGQF
ncbi:hypothetical protein [Propionivibrio sp.]|uniref:hypothetical protein n=1 Tax=Propionivibrio sp. TaxID=2212460 RepID=UPI003BF16E50